MDKYDKILVGDFVGEYAEGLKIYAVFVIDKNDNTKEILTDDVYYYMKTREDRLKWLKIDEWEYFDDYSQVFLHKKLEEIPDKDLKEKKRYLRFIKLKKIRKKIQNNLDI